MNRFFCVSIIFLFLSSVCWAEEQTAETLIVQGQAYVNQGDYDNAIADFTKAIQIEPTNINAYYNRGSAYLFKRDYDNAIADFTKAIQIEPTNIYAYYNRGSAYLSKRDYDRVIADFTKVIEINPNHADAYCSRGAAYTYIRDNNRAITDLTKAIRINPNHRDAYLSRGNAYNNIGDHDRAIADFTQMLRINPNDTTAYFNRGNQYFDKRDWDRAIADYEVQLRINSSNRAAEGARNNLNLAKQRRASNSSSSGSSSSGSSSSGSSSSNPMINEILKYPEASESKFAVLKCHTKTYTRDSYNATWFDRHKASGNPNIVINRKRQDIGIAGGALTNEYRFETTFYNSNKNVVVSVDVSLQFIASPVVYVIYIPYAQQNHYDRRRQVDEPSGKYALHEQSVPCTADDGVKAFIQFYEEASNRIITNFQ